MELLSLDSVTALVLVTDGYSEQGIGVKDPAASSATILEQTQRFESHRRPTESCRSHVEAAIHVQRKQRAGDNIAVALWHEG